MQKKINNKSLSLEKLGIIGKAWQYPDIIHIIEALTNKNYAILGGDVYKIQEKNITYTDDSWFIEKNIINQKDFIIKSKEKAVRFIENYKKRNGNNYAFSLVIEELTQ